MKGFDRTVFATLVLSVAARVSPAQNTNNPAKPADTLAVSGYEQELAKELARELQEFSPKADNVGNAWVDLGSGEPRRLIVTGMDQPGYVVSAITSDGYLRVQRLPQAVRYGSVDVAMGWPLRYAHSPGEVIDTKDFDALGKIVEVVARQW